MLRKSNRQLGVLPPTPAIIPPIVKPSTIYTVVGVSVLVVVAAVGFYLIKTGKKKK